MREEENKSEGKLPKLTVSDNIKNCGDFSMPIFITMLTTTSNQLPYIFDSTSHSLRLNLASQRSSHLSYPSQIKVKFYFITVAKSSQPPLKP